MGDAVNFDLTDDQEALRDGTRAVCEGRITVERVRAGFDRSIQGDFASNGFYQQQQEGHYRFRN